MVAVRARPLAVAIVLLVRESSSIERSVVMCDTTERCVGDTNAVYMLTMFRHADRGSMDGCGVRELVESEETTREQVVTVTFVCPHTHVAAPSGADRSTLDGARTRDTTHTDETHTPLTAPGHRPHRRSEHVHAHKTRRSEEAAYHTAHDESTLAQEMKRSQTNHTTRQPQTGSRQ